MMHAVPEMKRGQEDRNSADDVQNSHEGSVFACASSAVLWENCDVDRAAPEV